MNYVITSDYQINKKYKKLITYFQAYYRIKNKIYFILKGEKNMDNRTIKLSDGTRVRLVPNKAKF